MFVIVFLVTSAQASILLFQKPCK